MRRKLREMVYEGTVSMAMIYDDRPIIDHFRYVDDDFMAGIMEGKALGEAGKFYFYLRRYINGLGRGGNASVNLFPNLRAELIFFEILTLASTL